MSERAPEALEHDQFQIILVVYFLGTHLHMATYIGHAARNTGKAGTGSGSPTAACWL